VAKRKEERIDRRQRKTKWQKTMKSIEKQRDKNHRNENEKKWIKQRAKMQNSRMIKPSW
jgi:hypothetical protein